MKRFLGILCICLCLSMVLAALASAATWHSSCGRDVDTSYGFCPYCGEEQVTETTWTSSCGQIVDASYDFCPYCGEAKGGTSSAAAWPEMTYTPVQVTAYPKGDKRDQARSGPDGSYCGVGAYKTYKMRSTYAWFTEGGFIYVDMDYSSVGRRCVYFLKSYFKQPFNVPEVELTGTAAKTTQRVVPRYGPGEQYDDFAEATIEANTDVSVYFEKDGWVFAEFNSPKGIIREWLPADSVKAK